RELELLIAGLVAGGGCLGVEITVFDPDHDPDGTYAAELTDTLVAGLQPLRAGTAPAIPRPRVPVAAPPGDGGSGGGAVIGDGPGAATGEGALAGGAATGGGMARGGTASGGTAAGAGTAPGGGTASGGTGPGSPVGGAGSD